MRTLPITKLWNLRGPAIKLQIQRYKVIKLTDEMDGDRYPCGFIVQSEKLAGADLRISTLSSNAIKTNPKVLLDILGREADAIIVQRYKQPVYAIVSPQWWVLHSQSLDLRAAA